MNRILSFILLISVGILTNSTTLYSQDTQFDINQKNSKYLMYNQIDGDFGYNLNKKSTVGLNFKLFTTSDVKDFAYPFTLTLTSLSNAFSGNNYFLFLPDFMLFNKEEKVLNTLPVYSNREKFAVRYVFPSNNNDYLKKWGVDVSLFYISALTKEPKDISRANPLNSSDAFGADITFFTEPLYLNLYASASSEKKYTNPRVKINNIGYYSSMDFALTNAMYFRMGQYNLLKLDLGLAGYDVYAAGYNNAGSLVSSKKINNLLILPMVELNYYMELSSENYIFGGSVRYFDGHLKGGVWLQLFKYNPVNQLLVLRLGADYLTSRIAEKGREWETNEKSTYLFNVNLRYMFSF